MLAFKEKLGLFDDFEVNREPFWPVISRLLGGSAALHLALALVVIFIPPVRNALSITAMFSDAGFVDRAYSKTNISDGSDFSEVTVEKFRYPDGYFMMDQQPLPSPLPMPPFAPPVVFQSKAAIAAVSPTPLPVASPSPAGSTIADNKNPPGAKASPTPAGNEKAQEELAKTASDAGIEMPKEGEINSRPFKDLGVLYDALQKKGSLDVSQPFEIVIETDLDSHGKLTNATVVKKSGDPNLVELSKQFVGAINDSGILFYLKALSADNPKAKVVFTIKQDKTAVVASVESEATSNDSARILVKGFNAALAYGIYNRAGKSEEPLLRSTTASQDGKKIIFNFAMPREAVVEMIKKGIASPTPSPS